jgi:alcohol dehydrogenase class IV
LPSYSQREKLQVNFELNYPPKIVFGWGARQRLPELLADLNCQRPLLVCTGRVADQLSEWQHLCAGRLVAHYAPVPHDPPLPVVAEIVALARNIQADAIVAVGGGSVIDAAKAAAAVAPAPGCLEDYFSGGLALDRPGLPFLALPTTAGTGAEITRNAVLTDPINGVKKSLRSPYMVPQVALVDPELTLSMPPALTAASGLDALTQAVESHICTRTNAVSRALSLKASGLLLQNLALVCRDGHERVARTHVAEGSLLSAMAFSQSGLGAVHGLAHPIGLALDLPHGLVCAVLLPHILRWNLPECRAALDELAREVNLADAEAFVRAVETLCRELEIPADFAQAGLRASHFESILANCRSNSMAANPRFMSDADVLHLLENLSHVSHA